MELALPVNKQNQVRSELAADSSVRHTFSTAFSACTFMTRCSDSCETKSGGSKWSMLRKTCDRVKSEGNSGFAHQKRLTTFCSRRAFWCSTSAQNMVWSCSNCPCLRRLLSLAACLFFSSLIQKVSENKVRHLVDTLVPSLPFCELVDRPPRLLFT
jgi:hypothetical protein